MANFKRKEGRVIGVMFCILCGLAIRTVDIEPCMINSQVAESRGRVG